MIEVAEDTVWVDRRPFQPSGRAKGFGDENVVIFDPSCTPDYLTMPMEEAIPAHVRGKQLRVAHVVRIHSCPCGFKDGGTSFSDHMAQYHLLEGAGNLAVVGCSARNEWITVEMDEERANCLRQISSLLSTGQGL